MNGVYLLHYEKRYGHAQHYLGASKDVEARIAAHKAGNGGKLPQMFAEAGIGVQVARIWKTATKAEAFALEDKLKGRTTHNGKRSGGKRNVQLCPVCQSRKVGNRCTSSILRFSPTES